jgi:predicted dehydrogenase/nucleoside-diphosphate-sugar epimerase
MTRPTSKAEKTRRVALLGAGYIADWHAQCLRTVPGVELVAVCDLALGKAQALAAKFGIPQVYGSLAELLAAEHTDKVKLDAVHLLTPPDRHFEAARRVLEAGVDVFLEKPMCDQPADGDELVRIAAAHSRRLGVGHNFLFSPIYEQLRQDLRSGLLGAIDNLVITWHRPLPQAQFGPFDTWMLRDPRNILIEIGSHSVAALLDLIGQPELLAVHPSNPIHLPTGRTFYRRWRANASHGNAAVELRFSFVPGFSEFTIHARGSLAAATVDFERNTYTLQHHRPSDPDFDAYAMVGSQAKALKLQARRTLANYILSKLKLRNRGNPYGESIARAMDAFYAPDSLDERLSGARAANVIRICQQMGVRANLPAALTTPWLRPTPSHSSTPPRILVLGGTGFIGRELVRQLVDSGHPVRLLARSLASIPTELRESGKLDCQIGDIASKPDLLRAMEGIETVFHLARANVKTWADYRQFEIAATRQVGEACLEACVNRLVYTGTIDSYYAGSRAGVITEATPLDPAIARRNLYARAKAASEEILLQMHRQQQLPLVILRPGIVIGCGGSPFHWGVGMWWHDSVCQIWGEGKNKLPFVLVQDVACALVAAIQAPNLEGRSFNLVADPLLTAQEYLDELDRAGKMHIQRHAASVWRFYRSDLLKWLVKVAVRHPERRFPSYLDWESRTQKAHFDCTVTRAVLGWKPVSDRAEFIRLGIEEPLREFRA